MAGGQAGFPSGGGVVRCGEEVSGVWWEAACSSRVRGLVKTAEN